jgi:hypothetical protein
LQYLHELRLVIARFVLNNFHEYRMSSTFYRDNSRKTRDKRTGAPKQHSGAPLPEAQSRAACNAHTKKDGSSKLCICMTSIPASPSRKLNKGRPSSAPDSALGGDREIAALTDVQLAALSAAELAEPAAQRTFPARICCIF